MSESALPPPEGWRASLSLEVVRDGNRMRLGRRLHHGPLRIQRPFYPEGDAPLHLYLLHPPGGVVGGDQLETELDVRSGASALITTPAAQKFYRSRGRTGAQSQVLRVHETAELEWLPSESILFDGALARQKTLVHLAAGARFIGWEMICLGRPASGLPFARGQVQQSYELWRGARPLLVERNCLHGGSSALSAAWGYGGLASYGTLYCVFSEPRDTAEAVAELRASLALSSEKTAVLAGKDAPLTRVGVSGFDELLLVRVSAAGMEAVRERLIVAWQFLRPILLGRSAVLPRIWAT